MSHAMDAERSWTSDRGPETGEVPVALSCDDQATLSLLRAAMIVVGLARDAPTRVAELSSFPDLLAASERLIGELGWGDEECA